MRWPAAVQGRLGTPYKAGIPRLAKQPRGLLCEAPLIRRDFSEGFGADASTVNIMLPEGSSAPLVSTPPEVPEKFTRTQGFPTASKKPTGF